MTDSQSAEAAASDSYWPAPPKPPLPPATGLDGEVLEPPRYEPGTLVASNMESDNLYTTRRLRHDGWTPERMSRFHRALAETGVVATAAFESGMSAQAAYALRHRDAAFAAGWEAALTLARARLADELLARAMNGVTERVIRDGVIVGERLRYDNRLSIAVLTRLDARVDRAEERGDGRGSGRGGVRGDVHLRVAANWETYLDALGEGRGAEAVARLAPPPEPPPELAPEPEPAKTAQHRKDRQVHPAGDEDLEDTHAEDDAGDDGGDDALDEDADRHDVWEADGLWWTDYPPPADFDGRQRGEYGDHGYERALTEHEEDVVAADAGAELARAEAQRDAFFRFDEEDGEDLDAEDGDGNSPEPGALPQNSEVKGNSS